MPEMVTESVLAEAVKGAKCQRWSSLGECAEFDSRHTDSVFSSKRSILSNKEH